MKYRIMAEFIKSVSGEDVVTATTTNDIKVDILKRVEQMYDFVKGVGDDLKLKRFFTILDEMTDIARKIQTNCLLEDEQMCDVWWLIMMFGDEVANDMSIGYAREYLEGRLSSIIKTLQGEKILFRG